MREMRNPLISASPSSLATPHPFASSVPHRSSLGSVGTACGVAAFTLQAGTKLSARVMTNRASSDPASMPDTTPRPRRSRPPLATIAVRILLYLALAWGTLAILAHGAVPWGATAVGLLALYVTVPLAI